MNAPIPPPVLAESEQRINVRDETDVRILIVALSLFSAHEGNEQLARQADGLRDELMRSPFGVGYSSRKPLPVTGAQIPERR